MRSIWCRPQVIHKWSELLLITILAVVDKPLLSSSMYAMPLGFCDQISVSTARSLLVIPVLESCHSIRANHYPWSLTEWRVSRVYLQL